jgi:hypothetical protein
VRSELLRLDKENARRAFLRAWSLDTKRTTFEGSQVVSRKLALTIILKAGQIARVRTTPLPFYRLTPWLPVRSCSERALRLQRLVRCRTNLSAESCPRNVKVRHGQLWCTPGVQLDTSVRELFLGHCNIRNFLTWHYRFQGDSNVAPVIRCPASA